MGRGILMTADMIVLGEEQFLTLGAVISVGVGILIFLVKHCFSQITGGIKENAARVEQMKIDLQEEIKAQNDKISERINRVEEKSGNDIEALRQKVDNMREECSLSFVQRDEFFRYMNSMESNIKDTNAKVDKILLLVTERR